MADVARDTLVASVKRLLVSSDYSDFTITCKGVTYDVHKSIVCSRSKFFQKVEKSIVVEKGETNKTLDLTGCAPELVELLIQYLYEGEYDPKLSCDETKQRPVVTVPKRAGFRYNFPHTCLFDCTPPGRKICPHHKCGETTCGGSCHNFVCDHCCKAGLVDGDAEGLLLHAKMFEVGDDYDVVGLKPLAMEKFSRSCDLHWDTEHFVSAARYAFSTTPENDHGLHDIVFRTISDHIEIVNKPEVEALLNEFNGLAVSLLKAKANAMG